MHQLGRRLLVPTGGPDWLLRADFTGGATTYANTDTIGPSGSGATHEGYTTDGILTVTVNPTLATASLTGTTFRAKSSTSGAFGEVRNNLQMPAIAGAVGRAAFTHEAYFFGPQNNFYFGYSAAGSVGYMNWAAIQSGASILSGTQIRGDNGTDLGWNQYINDPFDESYNESKVFQQFAAVRGGWDSDGKPSPTGTYGFHFFQKPADVSVNTWHYVSGCHVGNPNPADIWMRAADFHGGSSPGYGEFDAVYFPNPTYYKVPELFTATNTVRDRFESTFGTADTGQSWTQHSGTWSTSGGSASCSTAGLCTIPTANSKGHINARVNTGSSGLGPGVIFLWTDSNNYTYARVARAGAFEIRNVASGVDSLSASVSMTIADNSDYVVSIARQGVGGNSSFWCYDNVNKKAMHDTLINSSAGFGYGIPIGFKAENSTQKFDYMYFKPLADVHANNEYSAALDQINTLAAL